MCGWACLVTRDGDKSVNTGVLIGNHEDMYIQMVTNNYTGLIIKKGKLDTKN